MRYNQAILAIAWSAVMISCQPSTPTDLTQNSIIPRPTSTIATGASFLLTEAVQIYSDDASLAPLVQYMKFGVKAQMGLTLGVVETRSDEPIIGLYLDANDPILGEEGYQLSITEEQISITANHAHGIFNGYQSLLQLLPVIHGKSYDIPTGIIKDHPLYEYRGVMLDVSRHFFSVEEVKRVLDLIAAYKINVFHVHLSDDQGWRIEIKSRPALTDLGSSMEVGDGSGGFYTQVQFKEIVDYASSRFITVIPEIDMPGHTNAALLSYPELNCDGRAPKPYRGTKVGFSTFCTDNEYTYEFLDDVIAELAAMTPGQYLHIGGDESHVTEKKDYIYFINRVQKIVNKYGKILIGWDEVATTDLDSTAIVQQWNNGKNAALAVANNNKVILSPATVAYMDMKYDSTTTLGLSWAGLTAVDKAYMWSPDRLIEGVSRDNILGVEAALWTETIDSMDDIEYMMFPRLAGYAEIGWDAGVDRTWKEYKSRLGAHGVRFDVLGVNFYKSPKVEWVTVKK